MRAISITVIACLLAVGAAGPALARDIPVGGLTLEEIAAWLTAKGYAAQLVPPLPTSTAPPGMKPGGAVRSSESGITFLAVPYECLIETSRCRSLQLGLSFNIPPERSFTAERANEWNQTRRYTQVTSNKNAQGQVSARLTYDFNLSPSVTYEGIDDNFRNFRNLLGAFRTFVLETPNPS